MNTNKYYRNINKRYIDPARSSSRGGLNQTSSRNTDREFAKTNLVSNAYGTRPSRNTNKPNLSHLNIADDFEMIERSLQVRIQNEQTLQPNDEALVSLAKPKQRRDD